MLLNNLLRHTFNLVCHFFSFMVNYLSKSKAFLEKFGLYYDIFLGGKMKRDNGNKNNKKIDFERMLDEEKEKGHRERLRQRFLSTGAKGFTDCEILELLLTYTVTRKNCRGIAGELLRKYRDLYTILKQPGEELQKNKYMTERAAVFFKLLFEIIENELYKKVYNERIVLSSNLKLLNYLKFSLLSRDIEVFKVLFLNTQNELLKEEELFFGTIDRSTVYIRELVKKILEYNAKGVILVHNHPSGSLQPSESDILLTRKVKEVLENIEIRLLDHLIISERGHFSFLEGGIL